MKKTFKTKGMHCKSCEMLVADSLEDAGASSVDASFDSGNITVEFDSATLSEAKIKEIIKEEGYEVL